MALCRGDEMREGELGDVERPENVNVHDAFECIRGELGQRGEEIACSASAVSRLSG